MAINDSYTNAMTPWHSESSETWWPNAYLGGSTFFRTPMQVQQVGQTAAMGIKNVEISTENFDVWQKIPEEHFEEMRRLAKYSGVKLSMHAPAAGIDSSGFTERQWTEENRQMAENMFTDVIKKTAQLAGPGEKIPLTLHPSTHTFSKNFKFDEETKQPVKNAMSIVDTDSGAITQISRNLREYPDGRKVLYTVDPNEVAPEGVKKVYTLDSVNSNTWDAEKRKLSDEWKELNQALKNSQLTQREDERDAWSSRASALAHDFSSKVISTWEHLNKIPNMKEEANKLAEVYNQAQDNPMEPLAKIKALFSAMTGQQVILKDKTPEFFIPLEQKAAVEAPKTWANSMFNTFEWMEGKKKEAAAQGKTFMGELPVLSLENWNAEYPMSTADELKSAILHARDLFADKLVAEKKMSAEKAKELAEKHIGATWDVAHINFFRKYGYDEDWMVKQAEEIAPLVKHVHIHDNLGFGDTHIAPGHGNTPIEKQLKALKGKGKMKDVRAILESAGTTYDMKYNPHMESLGRFNAPVYSGANAGPTWNANTENYFFSASGYSSGMGNILPQYHFAAFGGGWNIPTTFGSDMSGKSPQQSRFSGAPMS